MAKRESDFNQAKRAYNFIENNSFNSFSVFFAKFEDGRSSASEIFKRVEIVGSLIPHFNNEMYVLNRSHNSAVFSYERFSTLVVPLKLFRIG